MNNQKSANSLSRTVIKATGVVLYEATSNTRRKHTYFITVNKAGEIDLATHSDCPGFNQWGTCWHITEIQRIERELAAVEAELRNEEKMRQYKAGMAAQYASDPRPCMTEAEEETARANREMFYDPRFD